ncbi:MAG: hypothetical protein MUF38_04735 [Anaerolineae bacterium]|jgi:hypothetical protein|nr:hypothetical protein [Anaerolineae bacterium]
MELTAFFQTLLRRWYCVVLPVVVAGALLAPQLLARPGSDGRYSATIGYTAAQVLEAIPDRDGDYQDVWLASELTINAFTDWVRGSRFQEMVRQRLAAYEIEIAPGSFSVSAENDKSAGRITLSGDDEAQLTLIVAVAVEVLQSASSEVFPQLGGAAAQVELLDTPQVAPVPAPITNRLLPVIQIALAGVLGVALALFVDWADPYLRRRAQLEAAGIEVLSAVPGEGR